MVRENRITFEIQEISRVRLERTSCEDEIVFRLERNGNALSLPERCPLCREKWRGGEKDSNAVRVRMEIGEVDG